MKHIIHYIDKSAVWSLLSDDPITAHPDLFNKKLTVCRTYSQEATCVPPSLLMVYAFMSTSVSLSSLFNFTFCFRALEDYFTTLTRLFFFVILFSTLLSFRVIIAFLLSHSVVYFHCFCSLSVRHFDLFFVRFHLSFILSREMAQTAGSTTL